jgi:mono/diheme cytochrome c family protein
MRKGLVGGLLWSLLGLGVGVLIFGGQPQVHALPEYATRTGEPCATCHVNPAGGGPRTARGALWIAQGRPDFVPQLPRSTGTESSASGDGQALYGKLGCTGCHGDTGQGASGPALNVPGAGNGAEQAIRNGRGTMVAHGPDRLSDADLALVVKFVQSLATNKAKAAAGAAPKSRRPAEMTCSDAPAGVAASAATGAPTSQGCGGN